MRNLVLAILLLVPSVGHAQTAEETAAFILFGLEDGRSFPVGQARATVSETASSPAAFGIARVRAADGAAKVLVQKVTQCVFRFSFNDSTGADLGASTFDLSDMIGVGHVDDWTTIKFKGRCPVDQAGRCEQVHLVPPGQQVEDQRLTAAIGYLRANFCSGPAF